VGNAAGDGAKLALVSKAKRLDAQKVAFDVEFIEKATKPDFQERFANAIKNNNWEYTTSYRTIINVDRCAAELEKYKEGYGQYACGICMLVCPKGSEIKAHIGEC